MSNLHPFQKAGLGTAPFRCVGVFEKVYQACPGAPIQAAGMCDYCGTCIRYCYDIRSADGKKFIVGCDCVMKTRADVAGFRQVRLDAARQKRQLKVAQRKAQRDAEWAQRRLDKNAAFVAAEPVIAGFLAGYKGSNSFLRDMQANVERWGDLTVRQLEAVKASIARDAEREAEKANSVPCLTGRVVVTGTVRTVKTQDSVYGTQLKMVVRDDRGFSVWSTVPAALLVDGWDYSTLKGRRVSFTATLEQSQKDATFGFAKRPSKATFIDGVVVQVRGSGFAGADHADAPAQGETYAHAGI